MPAAWALAILRAVPWRIWAVCALMALAALYHWRAVSASYRAGYEAAKHEQRAADAKALSSRSKTDAAVDRMPDADLRRELREWVPDGSAR